MANRRMHRGFTPYHFFNQKSDKGFTLIEVLTVIAIIGILSAVVLVSVSDSQKKGRDGRRISDINQIRLALSLYYDANNKYPSTSSGGTTGATIASALTGGNFISTMPDDPLSTADYGYACTSVSGGNCYAYVLAAQLESTNAVLPGYTGDVTLLSNNCNGSPANLLYCATN